MMKLFAPKYYEEFSCIADKCRHSCCIGWEIDVDAETLGKYSEIKSEYANNIRDSIVGGDVPHFRLCSDGRCAHLDEKGLCRIISNVGEDALCDICREHPRFYHTTSAGREVGLGLCCEEACRIILSSDEYRDFIEIGEVEGDEEIFEFDAAARRARIYYYLSDRTQPYAERLRKVYRKYNFTIGAFTSDGWEEMLESLELLNGEHKELFSDYSPYLDTEDELELPLERALAYFVYRHCSSAASIDEFRTGLGFALFCERLLSSMAKNNPDVPVTELARIISEELEYSEENCEALKTEIMFL